MPRTTSLYQEEEVYTVSTLTRQLQDLLEGEYGNITVEGEVSGFKISQAGHAYFNLKDEAALLSAVMWRSVVARLKELPEDGQLVRATGGLTIYPPRGNYQLSIRKIEPAGEGLLLKRFEELKKKLEKEGLFDPARKKPIPPCPAHVAVVTSATGAAIRDFLRVLRRLPGPEVDIVPVRVQGKEAAGEIAAAVNALGQMQEHDVIVVTRGGGSMEDLWPFNEEVLARAIAACPLPVISGVGHEIDFSISDFVADLRVPTPTAAAQVLIEKRAEQAGRLDALQRTLVEYLLRGLQERRTRLEGEMESLVRLSPLSKIDLERQRVDEKLGRLTLLAEKSLVAKRTLVHRLEEMLLRQLPVDLRSHKERVVSLALRLRTLEPQATLNRGYSLTALAETGKIVQDSNRLEIGQKLRTRLKKGEITSEIIEVNHDKKE